MGTTYPAAIEPGLNDVVPPLLALLEAPVCFPLEGVAFNEVPRGCDGRTPASSQAMSRPGRRETGRKREAGYLLRAESPLGPGQSLPSSVHIAMNGRIRDPAKVRKNVEANRFEAT